MKMSTNHNYLPWGTLFLMVLISGACTRTGPETTGFTDEEKDYRDLYADTWVATDALGRQLPGYEEYGPPRENKNVVVMNN